jgi:hypothetical protein
MCLQALGFLLIGNTGGVVVGVCRNGKMEIMTQKNVSKKLGSFPGWIDKCHLEMNIQFI